MFTVGERDLAIKFRFSEIVRADYEPGLHFKFPYVNSVTQIIPQASADDKQPAGTVPYGREEESVCRLLREVANCGRRGSITSRPAVIPNIAAQRLLEIVKDGIRGEFAKRTVPEVVSSERREIMGDMLTNARTNAERLGIEVVDVRVKRIEFSDTVSESVFKRMREERSRVAAELRAEGAENAETYPG